MCRNGAAQAVADQMDALEGVVIHQRLNIVDRRLHARLVRPIAVSVPAYIHGDAAPLVP